VLPAAVGKPVAGRATTHPANATRNADLRLYAGRVQPLCETADKTP